MIEDRLVMLIAKRMAGELASEEARELEEWAAGTKENGGLLDRLMDDALLEEELDRWGKIDPAVGHAKWLRHLENQRRLRVSVIGGCTITAVALIVVLIVALCGKSSIPPANKVMALASVVPPGRNTATLILSNGKQILLDSAGKGELARQGNTRLMKLNDCNLSYLVDKKGSSGNATAIYNLLATPRAGQYQIALSDGSRVWLNNVSSLRYPTSFRGKDRTVELTGEAFFEIKPDATRPFVVKVRDEVVEALGTSFNIMAYPEEGGTQTTLVIGAVQISAGLSTVRLLRNQQSRVNTDGKLEVVNDVPSEDFVSWKDGFFYFGRASFETMMRQLARWYDVEVVYEGQAPDINFGGKIDRSLSLEDVLKFLDKNQIHFRLEGRRLIVLPK